VPRLLAALFGLLVVAGVVAGLLPLAGLAAGFAAPDGSRASFGAAQLAPLFARSAGLALVVALVAVPLGAWLAWLDQRADYPGRVALGVLSRLPLALPSFLLAGALRQALGPGGSIGGALGLPPFTGLVAAALVLAVATAPLAQVLVGAGLARAPIAEEEAARTLGVGAWAARRRVLLPRLRPALAAAALLIALYSLADFGAVAVLDCPVLTYRIYQAVAQQRLGDAIVLASLLLLATLALLVGARLLHGRDPLSGVANPRAPVRERLGAPALALAFVAHALVGGLGCALPVLTLVAWVADGLSRGLPFASLVEPITITLKVAAPGAAALLALAWAPAWLSARGRTRGLARAVDVAVLLAHALPGVLAAFGVLRLALALVDGPSYRALGESGALLLLGYASRFLPEAHAALRTAALAIDPRQDESARVLGASRARRLVRVALPAMAPGAAAAFVVVVASIVKELPITLLLGPACGARTLAFRVYDRLEEALLHDAGAAGLLLVVVCLLAFAAADRAARR
jgi:iron(III) transport system permease protein